MNRVISFNDCDEAYIYHLVKKNYINYLNRSIKELEHTATYLLVY